MINTEIKAVYGIYYCSQEEIAKCENGNEILKDCSGMDKIPCRLLQFLNDHENVHFMLLVGQGALYPWERGQKVNISFARSFISRLCYLREMIKKGIDNSKYQNFILFDTIIPVKPGHYFPEKDAKEFKGLYSFDLFKELADDYYHY